MIFDDTFLVERGNTCRKLPRPAAVRVFRFFAPSKAVVLRELDHPNVVRMYDFFENEPGYFFMVLEMMEGGELLHRVVQKVRRKSRALLRGICIPVGKAGLITWRKGVVH